MIHESRHTYNCGETEEPCSHTHVLGSKFCESQPDPQDLGLSKGSLRSDGETDGFAYSIHDRRSVEPTNIDVRRIFENISSYYPSLIYII